jgi:hypothetical protein
MRRVQSIMTIVLFYRYGLLAAMSTAPATASFEHAVAVCTETLALNTSTTPLIPRRVCIISSLISSATSPNPALS